MIRREIVTGAAVAATFLTAGLFSTPEPPRVIPPTPIQADAEVTTDEALQLAWPDAQPDNPTLVWPDAGCDAGMWSVRYELEPQEDIRTTVRTTDHRDVWSTFDVYHGPHWNLAFHPVTPNSAWAVSTDPNTPRFRVARYEAGVSRCVQEVEHSGSRKVETRAEADRDGIVVYSRNDDIWSATRIDNDCEIADRSTVDGQLATPEQRFFRLETPATRGPVTVSMPDSNRLSIESPAFRSAVVEFVTQRPLRKFDWDHSDDGSAWFVFWDDETTYLKVLEPNGTVRWAKDWDTHLFRDPVTHVSMRDGLLSVRGVLDSHHYTREILRIYDTKTDREVATLLYEDLHPRRMIWRWPTSASDDELSCLSRGHRCDGGVTVMRRSWVDGVNLRVQITRTVDEERSQCEMFFALNGDDYRVANTQEHHIAIYARGQNELRGWELDLDCGLVRETTLPASVLTPGGLSEALRHEIGTEASLRFYVAHGKLGFGGSPPRTPHIDGEVRLEPSATPVTHAALRDGYVSLRGALDTPPWSLHRDRVRAYDAATAEEVLVVDF